MMILAQTDGVGGGMAPLLLVVCATLIMVVVLRRRQTGASSQHGSARTRIAQVRDERKLQNSMDDLLVQLEEASRRVGAQVETRFAKLEAVIRDADDRIAKLRVLTERGDSDSAEPSPLRGASPESSEADSAINPQTPQAATAPSAPTDTGGPSRDSVTDPRFQRVYELADSGATTIGVAEQLGLPLGEVELILNLRKLATE